MPALVTLPLLLAVLLPSVASAQCPGQCNLRDCPEVPATDCEGAIMKDECGCCPVCEPPPLPDMYEFYEDVEDGMMTPNYVNASHKELCAQITCSRLQTCSVNIQGIPMCRCPSSIYCRQQRLKRRQGGAGAGPVCGMDDRTYRSRCFLRIKECAENQRIKVKHDGQCFKRKAGSKKKWREQDNEKVQRRKENRRETKKQRKMEKLMQREQRKEEKKEKRKEDRKALKKQERRDKKKDKREDAVVDRIGDRKSGKKAAKVEKKKRRQRRRLRRRNANSRKGKKFRGRRSCSEGDLDLDSIVI